MNPKVWPHYLPLFRVHNYAPSIWQCQDWSISGLLPCEAWAVCPHSHRQTSPWRAELALAELCPSSNHVKARKWLGLHVSLSLSAPKTQYGLGCFAFSHYIQHFVQRWVHYSASRLKANKTIYTLESTALTLFGS